MNEIDNRDMRQDIKLLGGSQAAQNLPRPKPNTLLKVAYIVIALLSSAVAILSIVIIVAHFTKNASNNQSGGNADATATNEFKNLTKAEAIAFLQSQENSAGGVVAEGFVGKEIMDAVITSNPRTIVSDLDLTYSYGDMPELEQLIRRKYSSYPLPEDEVNMDDFEIKEYDHYAIVTIKSVKETASCAENRYYDCDSLLLFKRDYLNYVQDDLSEDDSAHYYTDRLYVNTREPEIIDELLRVYVFSVPNGFWGTRGNIYSYSFDEQDDKFVLTVNYIGVGLNVEMFESSNYAIDTNSYAINLYSQYYAVDKTDWSIYRVPVRGESEAGYTNNIKSFPITQEEFALLLGYEYDI